MQMTLSINAWGTLAASAFGEAKHVANFVKRHVNTPMYLLPSLVVGSGPNMSTHSVWNGAGGVGIIISGFSAIGIVSFLSLDWHTVQYFLTT